MKWKKYQERLDLIFKERIEAYKVMNTQLFTLSDAVQKKQDLDKVRKEVTSTWIDLSVYFSPRVSDKILKVINLSALQTTDPDTRDKLDYAEALKLAKLALQGLEDITWLPQKKHWIYSLWLHWTVKKANVL